MLAICLALGVRVCGVLFQGSLSVQYSVWYDIFNLWIISAFTTSLLYQGITHLALLIWAYHHLSAHTFGLSGTQCHMLPLCRRVQSGVKHHCTQHQASRDLGRGIKLLQSSKASMVTLQSFHLKWFQLLPPLYFCDDTFLVIPSVLFKQLHQFSTFTRAQFITLKGCRFQHTSQHCQRARPPQAKLGKIIFHY